MSVQVKILYAIAVLAFASAILMLIVDPGWGRVLTLAGLVCAAAGMADNLPQLEKTFPQLYRGAAAAVATEAHRPLTHRARRCAADLGALAFGLVSLAPTIERTADSSR